MLIGATAPNYLDVNNDATLYHFDDRKSGDNQVGITRLHLALVDQFEDLQPRGQFGVPQPGRDAAHIALWGGINANNRPHHEHPQTTLLGTSKKKGD